MTEKHLRRKSKRIFSDGQFRGSSGDAWWYEEAQGICIIHKGEELWIPWARIRSALKRLDRTDD